MIFITLDILGTIAFAISGALAGIEKRLDFFGVFIIALVTSIGGGTLRDLLIGTTPVTWMLNLQTFYIVIASTVVAIIFRKKLNIFRYYNILRQFYSFSYFCRICRTFQRRILYNIFRSYIIFFYKIS